MSFSDLGSHVFRLWLGACVLTAIAAAQSAPSVEVGAGYAYNQFDTSASFTSHQSGGSAYGGYFLKPHARSTLGLVAEFSGSGSGSASLYTYMFGPRFNVEWKRSHLFMFGEFEFGGAHTEVNGTTATGSAISLGRDTIAFGVKDGVGVVIARRYIVNLFQIENLFASNTDPASGKRHGFGEIRLSGGFGLRFGRR